jgi:heat shock protein HslJ
MTRLGTVLVLLLTLAACAPQGSSPAAGGPWGRTFMSRSASRALVPGTRIELRFGDGKLDAQAGCNHIGGAARIDRQRLIMGEVATTDMGCDPARHEQDAWLAAFLQAGPGLRLAGAELVLDGGGTTVTLTDREQAEPAEPLVGTAWTVDTLMEGQTAGSVPAGVHAYLSFAPDGKVTGSGGCNQFGGDYSRSGDAITFAEVHSTLMACAGDRGAVEGKVLAVLRGTVRFRIEGGRLTLNAADGAGLVLTAGGARPSSS